ncbi:TPA: hypothetical protein QDA71_001271 [Burkholderia vietnamiensis]|nr:hypothetical protein [Burkholderia vietnamiensis]HDR9210607.1 hypothetical protein [Burkholderia vietnamiensis]
MLAALRGIASQVQVIAPEHVFARVAAWTRLVSAVVKRAARLVAAIQVPQIAVDAASIFISGAEMPSLVSAAHRLSPVAGVVVHWSVALPASRRLPEIEGDNEQEGSGENSEAEADKKRAQDEDSKAYW